MKFANNTTNPTNAANNPMANLLRRRANEFFFLTFSETFGASGFFFSLFFLPIYEMIPAKKPRITIKAAG
ncbi:MAG: hypothetical protein AAFY71_16390 [Bacteroidota bacterium]